MGKLNRTVLLLASIALSMQVYLLNGEKHSEMSVALAVPVIIDLLLIFIYIGHTNETAYKKAIRRILTACLIFSAIYLILIFYLMQLGKVYKN